MSPGTVGPLLPAVAAVLLRRLQSYPNFRALLSFASQPKAAHPTVIVPVPRVLFTKRTDAFHFLPLYPRHRETLGLSHANPFASVPATEYSAPGALRVFWNSSSV